MEPMAKGWTVQVTTHDRGFRCDRTTMRLFDVAIEDKDKALEAVRHYTQARPGMQIEAMRELDNGYSLSPGRVKSR
jgi:hypothetical protein